MADPEFYSLLVGIDESTSKLAAAGLKTFGSRSLPYDVEKLMEPVENPPAVIICGAPPEGLAISEVAQLLRMNYQTTPIFFLPPPQGKYDRPALLKNGFTDIFSLPFDQDTLTRTLQETAAKIRKAGGLFRSVKLVDMKADTVLDFDTYVYLPMNNKHVKFTSTGDSIDSAKAERLKKRQVSSISVSFNEIQKFYDYTARTLKSISGDKSMSETERGERLHSAVRELFSGFFNDAAAGTDTGKRVVEDCQKIVKSYIVTSNDGQWYDRILAISGGETDAYSHSSNVSTYAAIFAIALGLEKVEDIALAGLLHDIGLSAVPSEIQAKSPEQWTPEERKLFEAHPEHSVKLIQDRKLTVSELVHKIILQHHERFNGSGYPRRMSGSRICIEAQVLGLADYFDELTAVTAGKARRTPMEALEWLRNCSAADPGQAIFDLNLLRKVIALFEQDGNK